MTKKGFANLHKFLFNIIKGIFFKGNRSRKVSDTKKIWYKRENNFFLEERNFLYDFDLIIVEKNLLFFSLF